MTDKLPGIHGEGYGTGLPNDGDYSDVELRALSLLQSDTVHPRRRPKPTSQQIRAARSVLGWLSEESDDGRLRDAIARVRSSLADELGL